MAEKVTYKVKKLGYHEYGVYRNSRFIRSFDDLEAAQRFIRAAKDERKKVLKLQKAYREQYKKTGKVKRLPKSRVRKLFGG